MTSKEEWRQQRRPRREETGGFDFGPSTLPAGRSWRWEGPRRAPPGRLEKGRPYRKRRAEEEWSRKDEKDRPPPAYRYVVEPPKRPPEKRKRVPIVPGSALASRPRSASVVGADDAATPGSDPPPKPDDRPSVPRGDDLDAPPESDDHNVPPHDLPRKDHSEADDVPPPDRDALEGDVPEADDDAAEGDAAEGEHNVEDGDHDAAEHNTAEGDDPCSKDAASEEEKTERKRARDEPVCRFSVQGRCWIAAKAKAEESGKASVCRFVSWRKEARKKPVVVDLTEDDPKGPRMSEEDVACAETLRGGLRDKGDKGSSAAPIDVTPIDVTDAGGAKAAAPADATGATAAEPIDVTLDDEPAEPAPEPTRRTKRVFAPRRSGRPATSARLEDELKHYANEQERLLAESRRRFLRSHSDAFPEALPRWQSRNPYVVRCPGDSLVTRPPQVLGVPPNADFATCRKAFHKLALKYHPDKSKTPHSRDIFDSISKAYHSLSTTASTF